MSDQTLRNELLWLLDGGNAHISFIEATAELPFEQQGQLAPGLPHTAWELLEHLRICQWDILAFCRSGDHVSPEHPVGYWPTRSAPPNEAAWSNSIDQFLQDLEGMRALVRDPNTDLHARLSWGSGQTILREVLLVADHNAYHLGQLMLVRKALGAWDD